MQADDAGENWSGTKLDLAQGLVAGWMSDQLGNQGKGVQRAGLAVALIGLLVVAFASGWWRGIGLIVLCLGAATFGVIWLVRRAALYAIARVAAPKSMADSRGEIQAAIEELDLPTSPLAVFRFLGRLRRGAGPELGRLKSVVSALDANLKAD